MTDDEILKLAEKAWQDNMHDERAYLLAFARALLATPSPLSDEPVAFGYVGRADFEKGEPTIVGAKLHDDDVPLYASPPANPSDKQEAVAEIVRGRTVAGRDVWDIKIFDRTLENGTKLYTAKG